jgi:hypothetical protein
MNVSSYSILFRISDPICRSKNHSGNLNIQDLNNVNNTLPEYPPHFSVFSIKKIKSFSKRSSIINSKSEKENLVNGFKSYSIKRSILKLQILSEYR